MNEQSLTIKVENGVYHLEKSEFNEFELIGLLEQIVFDLKSSGSKIARSREISAEPPAPDNIETVEPATAAEAAVIAGDTTEIAPAEASVAPPSEPAANSAASAEPANSAAAAELRTRIGKAVKAVRELGGKIEITDLERMTEEELQSELEALTDQYKRLKASQKK